MSDMTVMVKPSEIEAALRDLGPIGDLGEAYVKVATEAYLHLMAGGSVNGMRLAPVDALVIVKEDGEWPKWTINIVGRAGRSMGFELRILDALAAAQEGRET